MKDKIAYFDSYAWIGRRDFQDGQEKSSTKDLLAEMEHCGINAALACHSLSYFYDPMHGNRLLVRELKNSPRLFGMWMLTPPGIFDTPPSNKIMELLAKNKIKAVKLAPQRHGFNLSQKATLDLVNLLTEDDIPIFIESEESDNAFFFYDIELMAQKCPKAKIVIQNLKWRDLRRLWGALKACRNIMIEFSNLQANRLVEEFVREFGEGRLLFGTGALAKSPGAAKAFLDYSDINLSPKKQIASENLKRLLKISGNLQECGKAKKSRLEQKIFAGKPLSEISIIDAHAHLLHDGGMGAGNLLMPHGDAKGIVERSSLCGIRKTCVSAWLGIQADTERGNNITLCALRKYPRHFVGYVCVDPKRGDAGRQILKWRKSHKNFLGVKPYPPLLKIDYSSPELVSAWKVAEKYGMFVLLHGDHQPLWELAERYRNVSWIIAHSGSNFKKARSACEIAKKFSNIYLEITNTSVCLGIIEFMADEAGSERILFGTDQPMRDPFPQLGWVGYSKLKDSEKKNILAKNMSEIIRKAELS